MDLAAVVVAFVGLALIVFSILVDEVRQRWIRIALALIGAPMLLGAIYLYH